VGSRRNGGKEGAVPRFDPHRRTGNDRAAVCCLRRGEVQEKPGSVPGFREPLQPKFADIDIVPVRIAIAESELKQLAKSAGGRWDPNERVWLVPYGKVKGTKLKKHII